MNDRPMDVPYIAHEGAMVRLERINKRLWILALVLVALLFLTNGGWLYYESQWETISTTVTQDNASGINNYIGNDGDINNGTSDDNNKNP